MLFSRKKPIVPDYTMNSLSTPDRKSALTVVLASQSKYREAQLRQIHIQATIHPADIDETPKPGEPAEELAQRLALAKARRVAQARAQQNAPSALIIGCDQTASCNGERLFKPGTADIARQQLRMTSGQTVIFYSAVALLNTQTNKFQDDVIRTEVKFRQLTDQQISHYVERERPLDCAGSFKCEGLGIALFDYIRSDDPSALVGLPLIRLTDFLTTEQQSPLSTHG